MHYRRDPHRCVVGTRSRFIRYRNGATQRIFKNVNICLTPLRWASPLVLWFICGPQAGLICSPPPSTQMHAHSIFMLTPYISHVCCAHREGGGQSRSSRATAGLQRASGAKFRWFECNESNNTDPNVTADESKSPTRPDTPTSIQDSLILSMSSTQAYQRR